MAKEIPPSSPASPEEKRGRQEDEHIQEIAKLNIQNKEEGYQWLISRLTEHKEKAEERAVKDKLTGLLNRDGFELATKEMLSAKPLAPETEQRKQHKSFSVLEVDIDFFKKINDNHGHDVGDRALQEVAKFLKSNLREGDVLCRQGGEEFLVLFPNASAKDIKNRFEGKSIEMGIRGKNGHAEKIAITLSGGIKEFKPGDDFGAAYKAADGALYQAKHEGRNRIVVADGAPE